MRGKKQQQQQQQQQKLRAKRDLRIQLKGNTWSVDIYIMLYLARETVKTVRISPTADNEHPT